MQIVGNETLVQQFTLARCKWTCEGDTRLWSGVIESESFTITSNRNKNHRRKITNLLHFYYNKSATIIRLSMQHICHNKTVINS